MNTNLKLMAAVIIGSSLAACGGSSGGDGPDNSSSSSSTSSVSSSSGSSSSVSEEFCIENPLDPACDEDIPESEIDVTNQELPFTENFVVDAGAEGNQVEAFFSPGYKSLATVMPQTLPNGEEYEDPNPSLWYATCCFIASEDNEASGEVAGEVIPDIDERQYVGVDGEGNGYMAISNARFTLGQLQPDIIDNDEVASGDAKTGSTDAPVGNSWGEFDLSEPYRVSFCLKDTGNAGAGTGGNLEVYVDNNSGGNQGHSIHGNQSLLLRATAAGLEAGNRVVIDVPGNVRLQDNNGDEVDLLGTTADVFGTEHSFFQFRVSSGGYAVISDLMVEHQDDLDGNYTPCEVDDTLFEPALPEGYPFAGLPLSEDFEGITAEQFIGSGDDVAGEFMAISSDLTLPFYEFNSTGRLAIEDGLLHISNNRFTMGFVGPDNTSSEDTQVSGDIDLSEPYTITFEIAERPDSDEGRFQVLVDNSTTGSGNSIHGENSVLLATTWANLGTGTLEINVPGDVTLDGVPVLNDAEEPEAIVIAEHYGTETSFLQVWCPSDCGSDIEAEGNGVKIESFSVENQGAGEVETTALPFTVDASVGKDAFFGDGVDPAVTLGTEPNFPMYFIEGGGSGLLVENDQIQLTNGARFTIGQLSSSTSGDTSGEDTDPRGDLDLSSDYQIVIDVAEVGEGAGGNFQVYVDNNTTSMDKSIHGGDSRVLSEAMGDITAGEIVIDLSGENHVGLDGSFIQIRTESGAGENGITLNGISIEPVE